MFKHEMADGRVTNSMEESFAAYGLVTWLIGFILYIIVRKYGKP